MDRGFDFWLVCQLGGFGITVDMTGSDFRILYGEDINFKVYNDAVCRLSTDWLYNKYKVYLYLYYYFVFVYLDKIMRFGMSFSGCVL